MRAARIYEMQICTSRRGGEFKTRPAFAELPLPPNGRTWRTLLKIMMVPPITSRVAAATPDM